MSLSAKHLTVPVSIFAGVAAALVTSAVAQSGGSQSPQALSPFSQSAVVALSAHLDGPDEAKGTNPTGDPTATGSVLITINTTTSQICANFTPSSALGDYTAFHIHKGDSTVRDAPPLVSFGVTNPTNGPLSKCVTDATNAAAIAQDPAGYYFNVHTETFDKGAISGQLARLAETQLLPSPVRVYDTRPGNEGFILGQTKFAPGETRAIDLSKSGIPLSARAAIVTVTVTQADAAGFLTVYSGALKVAPNTSNVNFTANEDIANNITVATDGTNKINITSGQAGTQPGAVGSHEDVVVDVVGFVL